MGFSKSSSPNASFTASAGVLPESDLIPPEEAPKLPVQVLDRALLVAYERAAEEDVGPHAVPAALDLGEAPEAGVVVGQDGGEDLPEVLGAEQLLEPVEDEDDRVGRSLPDLEQEREAEEGEVDVEYAVAVVGLGAEEVHLGGVQRVVGRQEADVIELGLAFLGFRAFRVFVALLVPLLGPDRVRVAALARVDVALLEPAVGRRGLDLAEQPGGRQRLVLAKPSWMAFSATRTVSSSEPAPRRGSFFRNAAICSAAVGL